ncbi:MAG TPA: putative quinol monooxygenase [Actinomycetes bacterium]|nr:putative quinol monooxygenase [Actinomycetes bacterium]
MIFIVVRFKVKPDWRDRWLDLVADFTAATRAEPGNLWFDWSRSVDDPDEFVLLEAFRDGAAGAAHVSSEHFKKAVVDQPQALAEVPRIVNVEVPGEDWSRLAEMALPRE